MTVNFTKINEDLKDVQKEMSVLINPDFKKIILNGTENAPQHLAVVYWSTKQNKIFFNSASLGELSQNQQYQLWAIKDGKPVDAGVFDPNSGILRLMKKIVAAEAFAVTIEKRGGSSSPTLSTMQVYGEAG